MAVFFHCDQCTVKAPITLPANQVATLPDNWSRVELTQQGKGSKTFHLCPQCTSVYEKNVKNVKGELPP